MVKHGGRTLERLSNKTTLNQQTAKPSLLSISSSGRLSKNPTLRKQTASTQSKSSISSSGRLSNKSTLRKQTTSPKNIKRVQSHVFERNLFQSRQKYLKYLFTSFYDLLKTTPVVSANYTNTRKRHTKGGDSKKIVFNIPSENNERSKLQTLLCLDNLHDFAVGGDNNVATYFQNSDELIQKANKLFNKTRRFGISSFETVLFLNFVGEYSRKNPISFICKDALQELYTRKINVDGDIFVDTTPVDAYRTYDNSDNIRKTLATYFDPSPKGTDNIDRYPNDIKFFNNAIKILKQNYLYLNDVDIELSTQNTNENFINRKYIFDIGTKNQLEQFEFSTGQNGDFSINSIQKYIHGASNIDQNDVSQNIVRLRRKLTHDQIISFLVLMKALGDFSQLFFAFKLNEKTNLITTVDKWLFTIGIHCLLNSEKIFNKDLFMLIGTGNTTEDKSQSRGSKILIYNDKEFFSGKTLRGIFESKYKNIVNFIFKPNENKYHIMIKDLTNKELLIKTVTNDQIDTVITSDILNVNVERFKDISFLLDISLEAISIMSESNQALDSYKSQLESETQMISTRLQTSILTQTLQETIIANYEEIVKELEFEIGLLTNAENASLTTEIKTLIGRMRKKYGELLEEVKTIMGVLSVEINAEPLRRNRKRQRTNGGKNNKTTKVESKNKEVIKKTIQKKTKNQKLSDVKTISKKVKK